MMFKAIIKEQKEELKDIERTERLIAREKQEDSNKFLKYPNILAVIGIRRCGKSIFSYLMAKEHNFSYINFDDERLTGVKTEDLNRILEASYELYGDIDFIVLSAFDMDDLYHHEELRNSIVSLVNPTHEKIQKTRDLLNKADLPKAVHHHISIRIFRYSSGFSSSKRKASSVWSSLNSRDTTRSG